MNLGGIPIQKKLSTIQKDLELITVPELHAVRHEWLNDPNEPDWDDDLPIIYVNIFANEDQRK